MDTSNPRDMEPITNVDDYAFAHVDEHSPYVELDQPFHSYIDPFQNRPNRDPERFRVIDAVVGLAGLAYASLLDKWDSVRARHRQDQ